MRKGKVAHISKAVNEQLKSEVAAVAQAAGKSESAYLAGLVRYDDDYRLYRRRREQQINVYGALCADWIRDLLALKNSGDESATQRYDKLKNRFLELQKIEKLILMEDV